MQYSTSWRHGWVLQPPCACRAALTALLRGPRLATSGIASAQTELATAWQRCADNVVAAETEESGRPSPRRTRAPQHWEKTDFAQVCWTI